jgi:hypothetical protein
MIDALMMLHDARVVFPSSKLPDRTDMKISERMKCSDCGYRIIILGSGVHSTPI